ncbi:hypothetical protein J6TS2_05390 [Heyndrickxia sporothermodurans]|nr:hypothetical protein J6TS2_05390 [Heyndrickxia sporothermodurans]
MSHKYLLNYFRPSIKLKRPHIQPHTKQKIMKICGKNINLKLIHSFKTRFEKSYKSMQKETDKLILLKTITFLLFTYVISCIKM